MTPMKEGYAEYKFKDDDIKDGYDDNKKMQGPHYPFKVEERIDIPTYDGTVDAEKLYSWIDQLETYFTLYGFSSSDKVVFARLKLTSHALAWWNSQLKTKGEDVSWKEFTRLLHVFIKYVAGLPQQIQTEMWLHTTKNISEASSIAMAIELKKSSSKKFEESLKGKAIARYRDTQKNTGKYIQTCSRRSGKDDRSGKRTTATSQVNDVVELESVQESDKSLFLMTKQKESR
uniref:Retrotransposon gag domain-containing protein n=1 Tax=Tanacetum cinerariifolium TaxID=118510 RepID=A0A6L2J997_TANCI|nr:hypothetical protein [Tanacetum cinerariifolium]